MALPPIARAASKAGRRAGDLPRLSQDAEIDPQAFGPESIAATIKWRQENPALAARQDAAGRAGDIEWWQAAIALGAPIVGGALLGGFTGLGAGAGAGAAGAGTAAGVGGLPASTIGLGALYPSGTGALMGGAAAAGTGAAAAGTGAAAAGGGAVGTGAGTGAATAAKGITGANIGRGLAALSAGRAGGRQAEAANARAYDLANLTRTRTQYDRAGVELDQRKFAQDLLNNSYGNSVRASFLQNATPGPQVTVPSEMAQYVPKAGPGIGDIPQARRDEIANAMYRESIQNLLDPLQPGTATSGRRMAALPEPDPLSETPEANWFDSALNYGSLALGAYYGFPQTTTPTNTNATGTTNTTGTTLPAITRSTSPASSPGATGMTIGSQDLYRQSALPSISELTGSPSPAATAPRGGEAGLFGDYNRVLDLAPEAGPVPQPYPWPAPARRVR
jgi:hypothetical protein